jgi:hypothetical protein
MEATKVLKFLGTTLGSKSCLLEKHAAACSLSSQLVKPNKPAFMSDKK